MWCIFICSLFEIFCFWSSGKLFFSVKHFSFPPPRSLDYHSFINCTLSVSSYHKPLSSVIIVFITRDIAVVAMAVDTYSLTTHDITVVAMAIDMYSLTTRDITVVAMAVDKQWWDPPWWRLRWLCWTVCHGLPVSWNAGKPGVDIWPGR